MPGFTHLQSAQPVTFGHHLLAYVEMLARDRGRFADARKRLNECPLGAAALAGTSFPIDREKTAVALGFDRPTANSLDSVADRDFVLETLAATAIAAVHLSRFAEEIVLWATPQFGFVRLSDRFSTGSSIMPQKRNPDAAELVRGKTGRMIGALAGLLIVMKGLPLAYSKDMQEDKEGTFDAVQALSLCVAAMAGMVRDFAPDAERMKAAAGAGYATATDLADWLVRTLGMPFRQAHHVTGALVALAAARKVGLEDLSLAEMQSVEPRITQERLCYPRAWTIRCAAGRAMAARRPTTSAARRKNGCLGWRGKMRQRRFRELDLDLCTSREVGRIGGSRRAHGPRPLRLRSTQRSRNPRSPCGGRDRHTVDRQHRKRHRQHRPADEIVYARHCAEA